MIPADRVGIEVINRLRKVASAKSLFCIPIAHFESIRSIWIIPAK
jgi:hypothetical protein